MRSQCRVVSPGGEEFRALGQYIGLPPGALGVTGLADEVIHFYGGLGIIDECTPLELGICAYVRRPLFVDSMERHRNTPELLVAVDDDFVIPVAPNSASGEAPDIARLIAIRVRRGEGVVFAPGVWHWIPYPMKDRSFALVGFRKGTAADDLLVRTLDTTVDMLLGPWGA
jgi:hypothetical protein